MLSQPFDLFPRNNQKDVCCETLRLLIVYVFVIVNKGRISYCMYAMGFNQRRAQPRDLFTRDHNSAEQHGDLALLITQVSYEHQRSGY